MYHFVLILLGSMVAPFVASVNKKLHINPDSFLYRMIQIIRTSALVVIGEMFFRADSLKAGFGMVKKAVTDFTFMPLSEFLGGSIKISYGGVFALAIALAVVFVVSLLEEKGISIRKSLKNKNIVLRWLVFYLLIMFIFAFGAYGPDYVPVDPIYAGF